MTVRASNRVPPSQGLVGAGLRPARPSNSTAAPTPHPPYFVPRVGRRPTKKPTAKVSVSRQLRRRAAKAVSEAIPKNNRKRIRIKRAPIRRTHAVERTFPMNRYLIFAAAIAALGCVPAITRAQQPPTDPQLHAREIVNDMAAAKFDAIESQFNVAMKSGLPPGKLAEVWTQLTSQVGAFKSISDASSQSAAGLHVVSLACEFERATLDAIISFTADGQIAGFRFVPHQSKAEWLVPPYVHSNSFHEQPITVAFEHFELPGTLTTPTGDGPFPIVVLVHGSGPHDEDETIGPNKTFKDLAWGLASHEIAVLRYTKRTKLYGNKSSDDPAALTVDDETINDARAAAALAAKQPKIDPKRVYVLGHSLGGYLAPRIATGDPQIAGLILMAGSARPLEQIVIEQIRYITSLPGNTPDQAQQQIAAAEASAKQIDDPALKKSDTVQLLGAKIPATYFLDLRGYDPPAMAAKLSIPILILQGARDYQVRDADYDAWKKALGGKSNVTFHKYSDLNHLFATGEGMATPSEYNSAGHVSAKVISDISDWIAKVGHDK
jgi:dienelactone hydrolase